VTRRVCMSCSRLVREHKVSERKLWGRTPDRPQLRYIWVCGETGDEQTDPSNRGCLLHALSPLAALRHRFRSLDVVQLLARSRGPWEPAE
jgi:hypothetical protein